MKDVLRLLKPKIHGKPRNIFLGVRIFLFLVPCGDTRYSLKHVLSQVITPQSINESAKYDGQSLKEAKISGLVYTLCTLCCPNAKIGYH